MTSNSQGTRPTGSSTPSGRPGDQTTTATTPITPGLTTTGAGGVGAAGGAGNVGVYDRDADTTTDPSMRHTATPLSGDRSSMDTRSGGSTLTWIISAIVLIVLVYFLLQWIF